MRWLLVFVPVAVAIEHFAPDRPLLVFVASGLAIVPLAAGWATRPSTSPRGSGYATPPS
jgi:Ca2+:H+ antiporter